MLDEDHKFIRMELEEIEIGRPLRCNVYDGNRQVVRRKGEAIATQAEAEEIFLRGAYRVLQETTLQDIGIGFIVPKPGAKTDAPAAGEIAAKPAAARPAPARTAEKTLDSSRIRVGDPILLLTTADAPKYTARLIGYLKNRSVIVTQPEVDGELVMLREGQAFTGRFFSGQSVYEFPTNIIKQTSVPYPLLHLAYPRELRVQEVRRSPRVNVELIAAIELGEGGEQYSGKIVDLGTAGAGLVARSQFADKGDSLRIKFKLTVQGIDAYFVINCQIRNVARRDNETAMPYFYGLHFTDVENSMQLALTAYVFGHLLGDL